MRSEYRAHENTHGHIFLAAALFLSMSIVAQAQPAAVSVSPSSGTGWTQAFTALYSDAGGYTNLTDLQFLVQTSVNGYNACYLRYNVPGNAFYVTDDGATTWQTAVRPNTADTSQNSQCILSGSTSGVSASGTNITATFGLTFKTAFAGAKTTFMYTSDASAVTGWQPNGSWTVGNPPPPGVPSISPSSGTGLSQIFTATYTDPVSYTNLTDAQFLVQTSVNGNGACYLKYNIASHAFSLSNDAGTVWQAAVTSGSYSENLQCVLSGSDSSAVGSGTTLTVHFAIGFKTAFTGQKNTYAYTSNATAVSGWQQPAGSAWNIQPSAQPPTTLTVQPSSGAGGAGTFTPFAFSAYSVNGFEYLDQMHIIFNWAIDGTNGCYVQYIRGANVLYLVNDAGTVRLGGYAPGTSGAFIENSQCKIDVGATSVTGAFNTLTVHPSMLFKSTFPGPQSIFMFMNDQVNEVSGWQTVGSWTGYPASSQPPTVLAPNPPSGTGMSSVFVFHTNDVNGYKYIPQQQITIGTSVPGSLASTCSLLYYQGPNVIFLMDDNYTSWGNAVPLGTQGGTLFNTQCRVDVEHSNLSLSGGNDLYLTLPIYFSPAFGGAKVVSMTAIDHASNLTGWQQVSAWTVQNAPQPDFLLGISPGSQTASLGGSASYTVSVTGLNGFNAPVNFTGSGLPTGASISFSPAQITSGQSTTLTINVPTNVQPGNYTSIVVTGSSGSLSHQTAGVSLNVLAGPDFTLSLATGSAPLWPGGIAIYTVTASGPPGYSDTVSFSVTGLPSWATGNFNPPAVRGTASTPLSIRATNAAPQTGTFNFSVTGSSGSFSHTVPASIAMGSAPLTIGASDGPPRASTIVISGRLTGAQGAIAGVQVQLSGSATASTTTDSQGHFQFMNLAIGGTYTATPTPFGSTVFGPTNTTWTSLQTNVTITFLGYGQ
jgi:hypothetical protein